MQITNIYNGGEVAADQELTERRRSRRRRSWSTPSRSRVGLPVADRGWQADGRSRRKGGSGLAVAVYGMGRDEPLGDRVRVWAEGNLGGR